MLHKIVFKLDNQPWVRVVEDIFTIITDAKQTHHAKEKEMVMTIDGTNIKHHTRHSVVHYKVGEVTVVQKNVLGNAQWQSTKQGRKNISFEHHPHQTRRNDDHISICVLSFHLLRWYLPPVIL